MSQRMHKVDFGAELEHSTPKQVKWVRIGQSAKHMGLRQWRWMAYAYQTLISSVFGHCKIHGDQRRINGLQRWRILHISRFLPASPQLLRPISKHAPDIFDSES